MNRLIACLVLAGSAVAVSIPGTAAEKMHATGHATGSASKGPASAAVPLVDGLVKKVDKTAGLITLSHGPLPGGMPAMTMAFRVKEAAWLEQIAVGQTIRFAADQVNGAMTVVRFEPGR